MSRVIPLTRFGGTPPHSDTSLRYPAAYSRRDTEQYALRSGRTCAQSDGTFLRRADACTVLAPAVRYA